MNILITGCAGFIGAALWCRFEKKYNLVGIDNLSRKTSIPPVIDSLQSHLFFLEDINNIENLPMPLPKLDAIIHLAAQVSVVESVVDPIADIRINAEGTLRMCMLAKKHNCKLIYSSTNKVYGGLEGIKEPIKDIQPINPETPYGISKAAGAHYVLDMLPNLGYVFHQSCIYGETQIGTLDQGWIGWLRTSIKNKIPITCFGTGKQIRDLLHVEDLLDIYELALADKLSPGSYVTGGGEANAHSFSDVVKLLGGNISKFDVWRPHDQKCFISSNEKLKAAGWQPKIKFREWVKND